VRSTFATHVSALANAGTVTGISRDLQENLFEENRLLCLPYPGGRNRRYLDAIETGFALIKDIAG
jgi:hypothetical protein